jgi:hypothetical protein
VDGPLLVVRLGPCLLIRDVGIQSSKVFVIQWIHHVAIQKSDKSSRLTGRTLCVSKKLLYTFCDVGHPHEMVFVESFHVFLDEMIGNQDDRLTFELKSLPGVSKVTISVGTLFSLTSEIGAKLFGHIFWENVRWVDGRVTKVKHTQILLLVCGSVNLYSTTRLLLPLMARRVFLVCIGCCGIVLASVTLFWREALEVGRDAPSMRKFLSSFLSPLPEFYSKDEHCRQQRNQA